MSRVGKVNHNGSLAERLVSLDRDARYGRDQNGPALDRLKGCLASGTCGFGEETVIILACQHFGESGRSPNLSVSTKLVYEAD